MGGCFIPMKNKEKLLNRAFYMNAGLYMVPYF